jgi:hypothetical protein
LTGALPPDTERRPSVGTGRVAGIGPGAGFEVLRSLRWPVVGSLLRQLMADCTQWLPRPKPAARIP